jgi:imidazolonepropionase-like amidohydrolase
MSPLDAIRTATTVAAEAMGWSERVGSLAVGRYADLVAVAGDPLDDLIELERPMAVVKGGGQVFEAPGARA